MRNFCFIRNTPINTLIEQLPINRDTKLIPMDTLTSENVVYWKCLVKHVQHESIEDMERVMPELSTFCTYISDFHTKMSSSQSNTRVDFTQNFILLQLCEIVTIYDLSDEAGRKKLNDLICRILMSNHWSEKIIDCLVTHLVKVIPDVNTRLDILINIISEIRLPLEETVPSHVSEERQHEINLRVSWRYGNTYNENCNRNEN